MDQKIFNNIILFFIVLYIVISVSPQPDSVLFVVQKYINYILYKIKTLLSNFGFGNAENFDNAFENTTFTGITKYNNKTPSFKTSHEVIYVKYFKKLHPEVDEDVVYRLYGFIKTLVSIDTEQFFTTPSDIIANDFSENEKLKLKTIILNKLNSGTMFSFTEFNYESEPKYYLNISGKEIDSFVFNVKSDIGIVRMYIDINIRNDVYENKEFVVINDIKPITDQNIVLSDQNVIYNISVKPKIKKTPFTGDVNLIFTNNSTDDYNYDDIEVEKLDQHEITDDINDTNNIEPVYNHNVNRYSEAQEKVSNNLLAYNEHENTDFINNHPILNVNIPTNKNYTDKPVTLKHFDDNRFSQELPDYVKMASINAINLKNDASMMDSLKNNQNSKNSLLFSEAPSDNSVYTEAPVNNN